MVAIAKNAGTSLDFSGVVKDISILIILQFLQCTKENNENKIWNKKNYCC